MGKRKNIVEKFISLIEKKYKSIEKELAEVSSFSSDLEIIEKVIDDQGKEDFSKLKEVSNDELQKAISILFKEDEEDLIKSINATHFLIINDIDLVEEQKEKLRELDYRATIKGRSLKKSIVKRESEYAKVEEYIALEDKLNSILEKGFVDNETLLDVFSILKVKEEEKEQYLKEVILFNYKRFETSKLQLQDEELELLELPEEIIDVYVPSFSKEELAVVFNNYGYDIGILNDEQIDLLIREGNIDIIDEVFESIKRNNLDFLSNEKKNAKLLTNFLLDSNGEIIDAACKIFKDAIVSTNLLKNYIPIFFPSVEEQAVNEVVLKRKRRTSSNSGESNTDAKESDRINGKHSDFLKNLEILEKMGYERRYLLERQIALLTISNSSLKRHIKELELYEFPINDEKFQLSTLISHRLMEHADRFIELGEEQYITKYCSRLYNVREESFDRLYALKALGLPYNRAFDGGYAIKQEVYNLKMSCGVSDEKIEEVVPKEVDTLLKGNKYKELLDKYLPLEISEEILNKDVVVSMDNHYKHSNLTYNIDGVLISRKKFLRNFEFLAKTDLIPNEEKDLEQILFVSAIYNSKLNMNQIERVNNGINVCNRIGGPVDEVLKK